jgi:hypothetical protein
VCVVVAVGGGADGATSRALQDEVHAGLLCLDRGTVEVVTDGAQSAKQYIRARVGAQRPA